MEEHRVHSSGLEFLDGWRWFGGSTFTVLLAPDGPVLAGTLVDSAGTPHWQVTACWVSAYLRRATLEIDRVRPPSRRRAAALARKPGERFPTRSAGISP